MKCIIAGGRDFDDYNRLVRVMDKCPYEITEVVCGKARGADSLGEKWALSREIKVSYFIPDWDSLGKRAGFIRNNDMAEYACKDGVCEVMPKVRITNHEGRYSTGVELVCVHQDLSINCGTNAKYCTNCLR